MFKESFSVNRYHVTDAVRFTFITSDLVKLFTVIHNSEENASVGFIFHMNTCLVDPFYLDSFKNFMKKAKVQAVSSNEDHRE